MSDLQALLRYQILDARNSGESAKHALMLAAADRIAELEKALQEAIKWNWGRHAPPADVEAAVNKALGL